MVQGVVFGLDGHPGSAWAGCVPMDDFISCFYLQFYWLLPVVGIVVLICLFPKGVPGVRWEWSWVVYMWLVMFLVAGVAWGAVGCMEDPFELRCPWCR